MYYPLLPLIFYHKTIFFLILNNYCLNIEYLRHLKKHAVSLATIHKADCFCMLIYNIKMNRYCTLGGNVLDFTDLVKKRYSVRKYDSRPVPISLIENCMEAARLAPSACNSQPWSFIIANTPEKVSALAKAAFSGIYSMNSFAAKAPVLIVVVAQHSRYSAALGGFFRGVQFSLMDVAIACEHICLQATELGLGTCMLGWLDEKNFKKELLLPSSAKIDIVISMGYPENNDVVRSKTRKTLDDIRRFL